LTVAAVARIEPEAQTAPPIIRGDARDIPLPDHTIDLVVTSPPYWRKRDYGVEGQIGQEQSPGEYVESIAAALKEWMRVLRPTGSVFLNIGDTYWRRSLCGIPGLIEAAARSQGWLLRNRIIWAKPGGMPEPARDRLAVRHEYVLHLAVKRDYYYDLFGYAAQYGSGSNPGDVWTFGTGRRMGDHLAPYPRDVVERAVTLACPVSVCATCGAPRRRIVQRTTDLDLSRPQARRALEIARDAGLTKEHIYAIQAHGISDVGKATRVQNGTGRNSEKVKLLAAEAKVALGGYFREFTFARRISAGWTECHNASYIPGAVLDPFAGTGTTLKVAAEMGRTAIGVDFGPIRRSRGHDEEDVIAWISAASPGGLYRAQPSTTP
jgi:DNA modification methylase